MDEITSANAAASTVTTASPKVGMWAYILAFLALCAAPLLAILRMRRGAPPPPPAQDATALSEGRVSTSAHAGLVGAKAQEKASIEATRALADLETAHVDTRASEQAKEITSAATARAADLAAATTGSGHLAGSFTGALARARGDLATGAGAGADGDPGASSGSKSDVRK